MAILQSCCFWKSVKKGSYASALYTLVYFGFSSLILVLYVHEEQEYLSGSRDKPSSKSMLEHGNIAPPTVIFNILFMACSVILVICSLMVIVALRCNKRHLMLPWIIFMIGDVLIELAHLIYLALKERVRFEPVVGFLFTVDFFIMCLNCYCLLCVVSQYQEYRQGRGCERLRLTAPQIVLQAASSQSHSANSTGTGIGTNNTDKSLHSSKLYQEQQQHLRNFSPSLSPFISSSAHPTSTKISTIPEEETEQQQKKLLKNNFKNEIAANSQQLSIELLTSTSSNTNMKVDNESSNSNNRLNISKI